MRPWWILAPFALFVISAIAGDQAADLLWPLPSSQVVTGGFADTRPDHFHGGVDIRAREPEPVVAPTDGWVERIAVSPSGYGRTLYFRLTDGRTAVFGHLSRYAPTIEEALRDSEIVRGTYRMDASYSQPRTEFTFQRGDIIAYTGKTGTGPAHLHFEIREGAVQTDPLANYQPLDHQDPIITRLSWTTLSGYSPTSAGTPLVISKDKQTWLTPKLQPIRANEPIAFFIQTYDPGPWGRNAVPIETRILLNGELLHETFLGRVDLAEPKSFYENIVWSQRKSFRRDVRRLFSPPPPRQYVFTPRSSEGWISGLKDAQLTIEVVDRAGNKATAIVPVTCDSLHNDGTIAPVSAMSAGDFTLTNCDPSLSWATLTQRSQSEVSILPLDLAFAAPCTLSYHYAPAPRKGLFFYERQSAVSIRPLWKLADSDSSETMTCVILRGGVYGVALDTIPPRILVSARRGQLRFNVGDGGSWVDDATMRCTVDNVTAIPEFEYDVSGGTIWTRDPLSRGAHEVRLTAGDRAGNLRTWQGTVRIP